MSELTGDEVLETLEYFMSRVDDPVVAIKKKGELFVAAASWTVLVGKSPITVTASNSEGFSSTNEALTDLLNHIDEKPKDISSTLAL